MKIGIVTEYFYPTLGGITENIYHFSRCLLDMGHDFRIITGSSGHDPEIDPEIHSRLIFIGKSVPVFFNGSCGRISVGLNLTKKVKEVLQRESFDILHLHSPIFPTLPVIANLNANAPVVSTFHTCSGDGLFYYRLYKQPLQKMLDRMAGCIAVSECCARENNRYFKANFKIIPNGVDVKWWSQNTQKIEKYCDGKINILFLGRPDKRNGLDTVISSFKKFHRTHKNSRLIIVGDGPLKFHFQKMVDAEFKDSIIFEGAANGTRPNYLATADIFVFTPTIASFGVTILEGMSAGKTMIASDIEAFRALLKNEVSALLVTPHCEDSLIKAFRRLAADKDLCSKLATNARNQADKYDWSVVAKMHLDYYNEIIA